jgi:Mg/Co/Ni transporter MgtE
VAGWQLRSSQGSDLWGSILRELQLTTIGGILSSLLAAVLSWFLFHSVLLSVALGIGFGITLLIASLCGLALPNLLQRLRLRGSLITAPLLDPVIAVISLGVFLGVALTLIDKLPV